MTTPHRPRRRQILLGLAALPLAGAGFAAFTGSAAAQADAPGADAPVLGGDTIPTNEGNLVIHPVAHATLVLAWGGHTIYVDPVGGAEAFEGLPGPTGILITHGHGDHFDLPTLEAISADNTPMLVNQEVYDQLPEAMQARAQVGVNGETAMLSGIQINVIPAYNTTEDRLQFHPEGVGNGYVLNLSNQRIYIAGDTEDTPEMRALTNIAVAFLPMNLPYTMTVEQAAGAVEAFSPGIVYPYHFDGSDPERFAELVGTAAEVRIADWYGPGNEDAAPPEAADAPAEDATEDDAEADAAQ